MPLIGRRHVCAALVLATLVVAWPLAPWSGAAAQGAGQTQQLPSRLTDQEFWKFTEDMSEPGGYFRSDNFLSNELGFQYVIPTLVKSVPQGSVYLGVGPEQNFTYMTALKPPMAIIFDVRRGNLHMQLLYKALFELSTDRVDFVSRLFSKPRPVGLDSTATVDAIFNAIWGEPTDTAMYRRNLAQLKDHLTKTHGFPLSQDDLAGIDYVYNAFYYGGPSINYNNTSLGATGGGFGGGRGMPNYAELMMADDGAGAQRAYLATDANFRWLKDLETRNMVVPVVGNFGGPKAIRAVGQYLRDHGATVGAFYASNVEQYLFQDDIWRQYYESVATLPLGPGSMFIRSIGSGCSGGGGGFTLPSVVASIQVLEQAYRDNRIRSYCDIFYLPQN